MTGEVSGPEVRPASPESDSTEEDVRFRPVERPPNLEVPFQAPALPSHFVSRSELLEIKETLLSRAGTRQSPATGTRPRRTAAERGIMTRELLLIGELV